MKRIVYLSILLFLFIPTLVLADAGGPSLLGYEAVVINKNGAKTQDEEDKKVIKYNTKIYVFDESDEWVTACIDGKKGYDCESANLLKSDVAPYKSEVSPSDFKTSKDDDVYIANGKEEIIINNKKGVKLKKGPADLYGTYDKEVPYRTLFTVKNYISAIGPGEVNYITYVYIDENGYKGWLSREDYLLYYDEEIIAYKDVKLYDASNNVSATVPAETIIKGYYGDFYGDSFVKYNDQFGYGEDLSFGYSVEKSSFITLKKVSIKSASGETRGEIPAATVVNILFDCKDDYYYVEYNGIKGFISQKDVSRLDYDYKEDKKDLDKETNFYDVSMYSADYKSDTSIDDFAGKFNRIEKIPKSGTVIIYNRDYHYSDVSKKGFYVNLVTYKGKIGCIITYEDEEEDEDGPKDSPTTAPVPSDEPVITPTATPNTKPDPKEKSDNMILYCIIGGVLLAITAIGMIIVINKKRKKKETFMGDVVKDEPEKEIKENVEHYEEQGVEKQEETHEENEKE